MTELKIILLVEDNTLGVGLTNSYAYKHKKLAWMELKYWKPSARMKNENRYLIKQSPKHLPPELH